MSENNMTPNMAEKKTHVPTYGREKKHVPTYGRKKKHKPPVPKIDGCRKSPRCQTGQDFSVPKNPIGNQWTLVSVDTHISI
jgi:hypothetical protein